MQIVYAQEEVPQSFSKAIFLAGPTPRSNTVSSWRPEAIRIFESLGYDGIIFVPEPRDGKWQGGYTDQIEWEEKCLHMADSILFWIPRNMETMPALTTNTEWGIWMNSGKVVLGVPSDAVSVSYQKYYAEKLKVPQAETLEETVRKALDMVGVGALRTAGEREVPLCVWNTEHFQQWYFSQKLAGNRLDGARVEWTFRVGPQRNFFLLWALHVNIYIASENRNKTNEVFVARPDIATIVMFKRGVKSFQEDVDIVLIREFRSSTTTTDGFIWEVPSGSSFKQKESSLVLAAAECEEETGIVIDPIRIRFHGFRQMVSTLSAHRAHLFSVEITDDELEFLRSQSGIAHGVLEDTERTYVEVVKLKEIMEGNKVDWSMLGMIMSVIFDGE